MPLRGGAVHPGVNAGAFRAIIGNASVPAAPPPRGDLRASVPAGTLGGRPPGIPCRVTGAANPPCESFARACVQRERQPMSAPRLASLATLLVIGLGPA